MKYENALNFLLFSYFGCDDTADEETMKNSAAHRAYFDLSRTVKYRLSTSQLTEKLKKSSSKHEKNEANEFIQKKEELVNSVCENLHQLPEGEFDPWHKTKCEKICTVMNESGLLKEAFTYGQAQKWVNMTLKYLWLLGLLPEQLTDMLHVPVDSYIIEAAAAKDEEYGLAIEGCPNKPWSKWEYVDYRDFQKGVRERVKGAAIEWEGPAWIAVAKKRAAQETV